MPPRASANAFFHEIYTVDEAVVIPDLEGDEIAERIKLPIPVTLDPYTGE